MGVEKQLAGILFRQALTVFAAIVFFVVPVQSQVYVGGILTSSETYSPANNPYIVTQDLIVDKNVTLTLLPGVEMYFEQGFSLISNGTLIIKGTPDQKISFLPKNPQAIAGSWNGIVFNSAGTVLAEDSTYISGSVLSDAIISKASYSVTLGKSTSLLIENTDISKCSFGIYMMESGYNTIRRNVFAACDFGIYLARGFNNTRNKIYENHISRSSDVGIFINSISSQSNHNSIYNNYISYCSTGLHLGNYNNNGPGYNLVTGNSFLLNKDAVKLFQHSNTINANYFVLNRGGVLLWQSDQNSVTRNIFSRNSLNAISLGAGSSFNNITYNNINSNSGGVLIKPDSSRKSLYNSFLYNTITNSSGFSFQVINTPQGPVQFNNLFNNGDFQSFRNLADSVIHGEYNFWGTTNQAIIDSIIYDFYDEPDFGIVRSNPLLSMVLSTAPVPPPGNVIKQRIGPDVVVSWDPATIADMEGYKVYYGKSDGISYEHVIQNGINTTLNMGNFAIDDSIAVTALDFMATGVNDQPNGFESDYSFAYPAPYAGPDTAICIDAVYLLGNSTAFNYENLIWSTSGDGSFDNIYVLHPVYTPGPEDFLRGFVYLYLTEYSSESQYTDAALITFHTAPHVFAGNDTLIAADVALHLFSATGSGYFSSKWTSSGDGSFNSDTSTNPVYQPGPMDIQSGGVTLTFSGYSACGSAKDQVFVKIDPGYSIEGRLHAGNLPASNSRIYLLQEKAGSYNSIRSGLLSTDGNFMIKSLLAGKYYFYVVPDKVEFPGYLPTYYFNDIHWENAYKFDLYANTYDVDVDLAKATYQLASGEGSIGGYTTSVQGSTAMCGDVTIMLYDKRMKNIFDWEFVRSGNDFQFKNLPFGDYILVGEKTGIQVFKSGVIEISPSQPDADPVELVCTSGGYKFQLPEKLTDNTNDAEFTLFPNPASDKIYVSGLKPGDAYIIRVTNSQGIVQKIYFENVENKFISLSLTTLPSGLYVLEVINNGNTMQKLKFVKK